MQQLSVCKSVEKLQSVLESLSIDPGLAARMLAHQYAVLAHDRVQFSGRRSQKFADDAILEQCPLGVGPRKAEQTAPAAQCRDQLQCAQNLGFLATHKIRRIEAV